MSSDTNKFAKKETERKKSSNNRSAAADMVKKVPQVDKKLFNMYIERDLYEKFTFINKKRGIPNSAILNMYIEQYVKEHSDLL